MSRGIVVVMIGVLLGPSSAVAGPILDAANRIASGMVPASAGAGAQVGCAQATADGAEAAERREATTAFLYGGIVLPVIMPIIGMVSSPTPPASELRSVADGDVDCFREGYRETGRARKTRSGWIGTAIGIGAYVALGAVMAAGAPDYSRR